MGLVAFLAAVCPAADSDEALARRLEHRLQELSRRWSAQHDYYHGKEMSLVGRAAMLDNWKAGSKEALEANGLVEKLIEKDEKAKAPLVLEMTIIGQRLKRYKETGDISPPSEAEVAHLRGFLAHPWPKDLDADRPPASTLSGDIVALRKQVYEMDRILGRLPSQDVARVKAPKTQPASPVEMKAATDPRIAAVDSTAKSKLNAPPTLPDLMDWLGSSDPRRRALAADELGTREKAAAPALPKLRGALSDPDARVRASAVLAISTIAAPTPDIIEDVRRALADRNVDVQLNARAALERLQQPRKAD